MKEPSSDIDPIIAIDQPLVVRIVPRGCDDFGVVKNVSA